MSEPGHNSADAQLRSFIDRILRLKEEQDTLGDDIKEIYAEAKGNGYDKTAMGALVSELRKKGKDAAKFEEQNTVLDLYREAYDRAASHTHTREGRGRIKIIEQFDAETGEVINQYAAAQAGEKQPLDGKASGSGQLSAGHVSPPVRNRGEGSESASTGGSHVTPSDYQPFTKNDPIDGNASLAAREGEQAAAQDFMNEPAAATETAGDYLRKPTAVVSGQIVLEGDAPQGTDHANGDAPRPDTDFQPPAFLARDDKPLRPHCQRPENCGGSGPKHCHSCTKAMAEGEMA